MEEKRRIYRRGGEGDPSGLREGGRARWGPASPPRPRPRGARPHTAASTAILSFRRTGCPWRYLPRDSFPPRSTVYNIFRKCPRGGVWEAIWAELHRHCASERVGGLPLGGGSRQPVDQIGRKRAVTTTRWVTTPAKR